VSAIATMELAAIKPLHINNELVLNMLLITGIAVNSFTRDMY